MSQKKQFATRLSPDVAEEIDEYATEKGISKADALRRAVHYKYLNSPDGGQVMDRMKRTEQELNRYEEQLRQQSETLEEQTETIDRQQKQIEYLRTYREKSNYARIGGLTAGILFVAAAAAGVLTGSTQLIGGAIAVVAAIWLPDLYTEYQIRSTDVQQ